MLDGGEDARSGAFEAEQEIDPPRELSRTFAEAREQSIHIALGERALDLRVPGAILALATNDLDGACRLRKSFRVLTRVQELTHPDPVRTVAEHVLGESVLVQAVEDGEE